MEFSVNDSSSNTSKITYDNLVRKILKDENHPAVILLFMGQTNSANAQDVHVLVGFNYKLPMVSYANVISDMMEGNLYTDKALSGNVTHPSTLGHAITGEILWKYLNSVYADMDSFGEPEPFDEPAVTREVYLDAEAKKVYSSDDAAEHTIVIKKAEDSTGDVFTVLGVMVAR